MRHSLIIVIVLLIIGLFSGLFFINYYDEITEEILKLNIEKEIKYISNSKINEINNFLVEQDKIFRDYSNEKVFINFLNSENRGDISSEEFDRAKTRIDEIGRGIAVFDKDGYFLVSENNPVGVRVSNPDFFYGLGDKSGHLVYYDYPREKYYLGLAFLIKNPESGKVLGYFGGDMDLDDLSSIMNISDEAGTDGEIYIIDENSLLLTPSKFLEGENKGVLVQVVNTKNSNNCFDETFSGHRERAEPIVVGSFLDYRGEKVFGTHREIFETGWCLLIEFNEESTIKNPLKEQVRDIVFFSLVIIIFISLIVFFVEKYFKEKKRKVEKKHGIFWRLLERDKTITKINKFFGNLKLRYYFLFAIIFSIAYFFFVTSFFQGWQNAKLFDDIPDLLIFIVGFMIFAHGLKIKNMKAKNFIIFGGLLICLRRLLDVPFQEYQAILLEILTPFFWIPVLFAEFIGFIFLLIGYRRLKHAF